MNKKEFEQLNEKKLSEIKLKDLGDWFQYYISGPLFKMFLVVVVAVVIVALTAKKFKLSFPELWGSPTVETENAMKQMNSKVSDAQPASADIKQ